MSTAKHKSIDISLSLGFLKVGSRWDLNDEQANAAWEMYIELVTRVTGVSLEKEGILREALNSIYSIFGSTREILKKYGPILAQPASKETDTTFGHIAVKILNQELRPFLTYWHPILQDYENLKKAEVSIKKHEDNWTEATQLRSEINQLRIKLLTYADVLAEVSEITKLHS